MVKHRRRGSSSRRSLGGGGSPRPTYHDSRPPPPLLLLLLLLMCLCVCCTERSLSLFQDRKTEGNEREREKEARSKKERRENECRVGQTSRSCGVALSLPLFPLFSHSLPSLSHQQRDKVRQDTASLTHTQTNSAPEGRESE